MDEGSLELHDVRPLVHVHSSSEQGLTTLPGVAKTSQ